MNYKLLQLLIQLKGSVLPVIPLLSEIRLLLIETGEDLADDEIVQAIGDLSSAVVHMETAGFVLADNKKENI